MGVDDARGMSSAWGAVRAAEVDGKKKRLVSKTRTKLVKARPSLRWRPRLLPDRPDPGGGCCGLGGTKPKILLVLLLLGTIAFAASDPSTTHLRERQPQGLHHQQLRHHLSHQPRDFNATKSAW